MARRYWVTRKDAAGTVAGPFETERAAEECRRALEAETGAPYDCQPHP